MMPAGVVLRGVGREMEDISEAVGASRTIFLCCRVVMGRDGSAKGGLRRPSLGVIMYFWCGCGMLRSVSILDARSVMVASGGSSKLCRVPWCVNAIVTGGDIEVEEEEGGGRDGFEEEESLGGCSISVIASYNV